LESILPSPSAFEHPAALPSSVPRSEGISAEIHASEPMAAKETPPALRSKLA
jgi:hypothetical protein